MEPESNTTTTKHIILISIISIVAALLLYLPFLVRSPNFNGVPFNNRGMDAVYHMWDGPLYITVANTLYDSDINNPWYQFWKTRLPNTTPSGFAERFPIFPIMIRILSPLFGFGAAALVINVAASTLVTIFQYLLLLQFGVSKNNAFWVSLASIFWPPRGFLYRYVIMCEPLFTLGLIGAVYFFRLSRFNLSGLFGALAAGSRPNSFLAVAGLGSLCLVRLCGFPPKCWLYEIRRMSGMFLAPITLMGVYFAHYLFFGDWLVSFKADTFPKLQTRLYPAIDYYGVGSESVAYFLLLLLTGIFALISFKEWGLAALSLFFYIPCLITPGDISRFLLPIYPFAFFLAGERIIAQRPFRFALILSLPIIYIYTWKTMLTYQAPVIPPFLRLLGQP